MVERIYFIYDNVNIDMPLSTQTAGDCQWKYSDDNRTVAKYIKPKRIMSDETKRKLSASKNGNRAN